MNSRLKAKSLMGGLAALLVLGCVVSTAVAQPGLQYTFVQGTDDLNKLGGITDVSGHGHNGTVIDATTATFVPGPSGKMNAIHFDKVDDQTTETAGSGINTGTLTDNPDLNIFNGPYTCMAWVNLDAETGDQMVFGTPPPNPPGASANTGSLHLGFRNMQVYNGWWGAGTTRDSAYDNQGNSGYVGQPGEWHHVAWTFDGSSSGGLQSIYQDGLLYQSFRSKVWYGGPLLDSGGVPNVAVNLLIGRTVANNGAFGGALSDVRVYPTALAASDIQNIAASPP